MNILNAGKKMVTKFAREDDGAQIVEYGMIIGAVSLALIGLLVTIGDSNFSGLVTRITTCLKGQATCGAAGS